MRSLASALSLLTTGIGSFLAAGITTAITTVSTRDGGPGWIPDNLNQVHPANGLNLRLH